MNNVYIMYTFPPPPLQQQKSQVPKQGIICHCPCWFVQDRRWPVSKVFSDDDELCLVFFCKCHNLEPHLLMTRSAVRTATVIRGLSRCTRCMLLSLHKLINFMPHSSLLWACRQKQIAHLSCRVHTRPGKLGIVLVGIVCIVVLENSVLVLEFPLCSPLCV